MRLIEDLELKHADFTSSGAGEISTKLMIHSSWWMAMRSCIIFYENPDHNFLVLVPVEDLNQQI